MVTAAVDEVTSAQVMMDLDGSGPGTIRLVRIDSPYTAARPHQALDNGLLDCFQDNINPDDSDRPRTHLRRARSAPEDSEGSDAGEEVVPE